MAWKITDPEIGLQAITETSTTQKHSLGHKITAFDSTYGEGEFIYCVGVADTAIGSAVQINPYGHTTALVDTDVADTIVGSVGIAMSANVASQYGWYQIRGTAIALGLASLADNAKVFATATAGSLDDSGTGGQQVIGAKTASALDTPATGQFLIELSYPWLGANVA
jgi:hypothetical protein